MDYKEIKNIPVFFIIGRPRSGNTMLRFIFDAHPNVSIPLEGKVITSLFRKYYYIKIWSREKLQEFFDDVFLVPQVEFWTLNKKRLKDLLLNAEETVTFQELIKLIYLCYDSFFEKNNIFLIGDKNPFYSYDATSMKILLKVFPDAKFIHINRDYRDHYLSMRKVKFEGNNLSLVCFRWKYSFKLISDMLGKSPNYYYLKYEDLVSNPMEETKKLCLFLNMEYHDDMIHYYKIKDKFLATYPEEEVMKLHSSLLKPINKNNVYGWKEKLEDRKVYAADTIIGKYAEQAGYERKYRSKNILFSILQIPIQLYCLTWLFLNSLYCWIRPNAFKHKRITFAEIYFSIKEHF